MSALRGVVTARGELLGRELVDRLQHRQARCAAGRWVDANQTLRCQRLDDRDGVVAGIGDGRVFVYPVEQAVRIRTDERGEDTVRHEQAEYWGH